MGKLMVSGTHIQFGVRSQVDWESREEACGPRGRSTYRIYHTSAFYLKGQTPSFFPLLALCIHRLLVTCKRAWKGQRRIRGGGTHRAQGSWAVGGVPGLHLQTPGPALSDRHHRHHTRTARASEVQTRASGPGRQYRDTGGRVTS